MPGDSMSTAERLEQYYPFDSRVVDEISEFDEFQRSFDSYQDFFGAVGLPDVRKFSVDGSTGFDVVDVRPNEHDTSKAIVLDLPMANGLTYNQLSQVATVAGTNPESRVIAIGNPSFGKYKGKALERDERQQLKNGSFEPLATNLVRYLEAEKITDIKEAGYSYGTLQAMAAAIHGNYAMSHLVLVEPVTPARSLYRLTSDFVSTSKALDEYSSAPNLPIYREARDASPSDAAYVAGLLRPTNIAIAQALAKSSFRTLLLDTFTSQPDAQFTLSWGSESELAEDESLTRISNILSGNKKYGDRFQSIRLEGQKHALANDIHLHAAIIRQGFSS